MRLPRILPILLLTAAVPAHAAAQRYAAPTGTRGVDTTAVFGTGDEIRVTSYPRMASGIELCGTVTGGMQWGKMLFARTDQAPSSAQQAVVSFPSVGVTPQCQTYRPDAGDLLVVSFARPVRDELGRIGRITVGEIVLPVSLLQGRRVTFRWQREGPFDVGRITPPPDTLGPRRP